MAAPGEPALLFAALGDPTRLGLITRLSDGRARSMTEMGDGLPISRQAVAKHLDILWGAGLVRRTKSGREVLFALNKTGVDSARGWLEQIGAQWDETLLRLKLFAENEP
ncbi:MAG TPA: metalloregulator ArsR/SmtB family transcription factor [Sphingobium sp.]|nr:metalloregulator ArsR/SmtB family transcription factor [Sphingobium sp.]